VSRPSEARAVLEAGTLRHVAGPRPWKTEATPDEDVYRTVRRKLLPGQDPQDKKNGDGTLSERPRKLPGLQCDCTVVSATGRVTCSQQGTCTHAWGVRAGCRIRLRAGSECSDTGLVSHRTSGVEGSHTGGGGEDVNIPSPFGRVSRAENRASPCRSGNRRSARVVAWSLLAAWSLACATARPQGPVPLAGAGAILLVSNNTPEDQPIYLRRASAEIPIGVVTSFTSRTFVLPGAYLGAGSDYSLVARRRGMNEAMRSELFRIPPGATVRWIVDRSHFAVAEVRR
jgi:hypothetical protein